MARNSNVFAGFMYFNIVLGICVLPIFIGNRYFERVSLDEL